MLYELIGITRVLPDKFAETKIVVSKIGKLILNNGGIIRNLDNMGQRILPKVISKRSQRFIDGVYWSMVFDASPSSQILIRKELESDPRVIKATIFKRGSNLKQYAELSRKLDSEWREKMMKSM